MKFQSVRNDRSRLVMTPSQWIKRMRAIGLRSSKASEADLLNIALFGMTAKEFKTKFSDKNGNHRGNATIEQNIIMASLESSNALMIRQDLPQVERLKVLCELAVTQLKSVTNVRATERIKRLANG